MSIMTAFRLPGRLGAWLRRSTMGCVSAVHRCAWSVTTLVCSFHRRRKRPAMRIIADAELNGWQQRRGREQECEADSSRASCSQRQRLGFDRWLLERTGDRDRCLYRSDREMFSFGLQLVVYRLIA